MSTTLHTFSEIFNTSIESDSEQLKVNQIVIPIIQRDYAQGRRTNEIDRVRDRFLDSLYKAVTEEPIILDFVFGDIDKDGIMTPLDGQQRLTTLFLLYWYAAKKEKVDEDVSSFLYRFSYETRYSAREFCKELCGYQPTFEEPLSDEIVDEAWFPLEWKKDPTISSMLVMIDSIFDKFKDVNNLWGKLEDGAISFYFLPIKDMGLTDELYIKMNSRGKLLTQFEHFKAEFERNTRKYAKERTNEIIAKIDIAWTDMLWAHRGDDNLTDDEFLRYFKYVCDLICYKEGGTPQGRSYDEFFLLNEYFNSENEHINEHLCFLEDYFDCWCEVSEKYSTKEFFAKFISTKHEEGKILLQSGDVDLFADCVNEYGIVTSGNRRFPLNKVVLLYAFITYLLNSPEISEEQFKRRLRIVNNLCRNSEDELSDSESRASGNRMPAILKQVDSIIIQGIIDDSIEPNFNAFQIEEEKEKLAWTKEHSDESETLFKLEDHILLIGQIGIVGLDNIDLAGRFEELFSCSYDLVNSALMTEGFYGQNDRTDHRYQLGTKNQRSLKAWRNLFHKSANGRYDETKRILLQLLRKGATFSDEVLESIVFNFTAACESANEYPMEYYYVKYDCFRPNSYGKYYWEDYDHEPYKFLVMQTNSYISQNSYDPFLYAADSESISKEDFGQCIIFGDDYIACFNDEFEVVNIESDKKVDTIPIKQNDNGIDLEERIIKLKEYIEEKTQIQTA